MPNTIADNRNCAERYKPRCLEAGVGCKGLCARGLLLLASLELDGFPAARDGKEKGDGCEEVED